MSVFPSSWMSSVMRRHYMSIWIRYNNICSILAQLEKYTLAFNTDWHKCLKPADCTQPFGPFVFLDDGWATAFQSGLSALRGLERSSRAFLEADSWGHLSAASCYRQRAEHFLPLTYMFSISPDNVLPKSLFSRGKEKQNSEHCPAMVNCLLFCLWRGQNVLGPAVNILHHK